MRAFEHGLRGILDGCPVSTIQEYMDQFETIWGKLNP